MKIQICRNAKCVERGDVPIMMIREFNGTDANLIVKTRAKMKGIIMIGIKDVASGDCVKEWPLLKQINEDRQDPDNPNEREEIIRYVVDDRDIHWDTEGDWENKPCGNMGIADSQGSELIDPQ